MRTSSESHGLKRRKKPVHPRTWIEIALGTTLAVVSPMIAVGRAAAADSAYASPTAAPVLPAAPPATPAARPPAPGAVDKATLLMAAKRYSEAIRVLEREAKAHPGAPDVLLNLGWAYWHANRVNDAWRVASTLVKLDPGNRVFLIFMANTDIERKNYSAAIELMHRALKQAPDDHDALMVLARAMFLGGRRNDALIILNEILARRPDDAAAVYRKAVFLSEMGRKREALAFLDKLLAAEPSNPAYRRSRAKILSDLGRETEARSEWKQLTRKEMDAQSLMNLGWAHWRERNLDAAWEIAVTLVKLDDKNPSFLRFMANLELERQNYHNALRLAEKTVSLAPQDRDAALTLSKALFRLQRVKEAMVILQKLIISYPESNSVQYRWAELLAGTKRYGEALFYFDRLIKADPENATYRMNRASLLYEMGRFDEGLAEWRTRASKKEPDISAIRRLRDDAVNRRAWEEAINWQVKLVAGSPADPAGWEALSRIYGEIKQLPMALWAVERAIAADPVGMNAYYMRAEILERMSDWDAATDAYEEVIRRNPNSIRAIDGLSFTLEAKGDFKGALKQIKRIEELTLPPSSPYLELQRARLLADSGWFAKAHKILKRLEADQRTVIPALLYHGISRFDRGDSIPVENFRKQMLALKKKGYETITVSELAKVFQGKASLPAKPLLLTFDDGRSDSFENADPVLKELGFRATMFVHVSKQRKPYFHASPEDIARWAATGRWEMQAHGSQAHDPMLIDGFGRRGHFLPNRMWLRNSNRLETLEEYRTRVENDYKDAKRGVEEIIPGHKVLAFAYPFGDYGQNDYSNTPESAVINQALVKKSFALAFVQEQHGINTLSSNVTNLKRYSVPRHMSAEALVSHLTLGDPRVQAKLLHAQLWIRADQLGRAKAVFKELEAMGIDESRLLADKAVAFQRGGDISYARRLFTQAAEQQPDKEGPSAEADKTHLEQSARAAAPRVEAEVQRFTDSDRNEISRAIARGGGILKTVRIEGWAGQGEYFTRRHPAAIAPIIRSREGGVQMRWFAADKLELNGFYARREFDWGFKGFADNYAVAASYQALPYLGLTLRDGMGNVETADAIRQSRKYHTDGGGIVLDPALNWKIAADYDQSRYNDSNLQQDVRLRLSKRFSERVTVAAVYFHGESKRSQVEYYTPRRLNQYTGSLTLSQLFGEVNARTGNTLAEAQVQYEGGYGFQPEGSRGVQSLRAGLGLHLLDHLALRLSGQYAQSPTYISRRAEGTLSVGF